MQKDDRQRPARAKLDDMQPRAGDVDHPALRGMGALHQRGAGHGDQRQGRQRRQHDQQEHREDPDDGHGKTTDMT